MLLDNLIMPLFFHLNKSKKIIINGYLYIDDTSSITMYLACNMPLLSHTEKKGRDVYSCFSAQQYTIETQVVENTETSAQVCLIHICYSGSTIKYFANFLNWVETNIFLIQLCFFSLAYQDLCLCMTTQKYVAPRLKIIWTPTSLTSMHIISHNVNFCIIQYKPNCYDSTRFIQCNSSLLKLTVFFVSFLAHLHNGLILLFEISV